MTRRRCAQQKMVKGHARHVLHCEEPQWPLSDQLVQSGQVGVLDVGEGAELAFEPVQVHAVPKVEQLERNLHAQLSIEDQVHSTHTPAAEEADDLEPICAYERHR